MTELELKDLPHEVRLRLMLRVIYGDPPLPGLSSAARAEASALARLLKKIESCDRNSTSHAEITRLQNLLTTKLASLVELVERITDTINETDWYL